jgi:hypothetical protein
VRRRDLEADDAEFAFGQSIAMSENTVPTSLFASMDAPNRSVKRAREALHHGIRVQHRCRGSSMCLRHKRACSQYLADLKRCASLSGLPPKAGRKRTVPPLPSCANIAPQRPAFRDRARADEVIKCAVAILRLMMPSSHLGNQSQCRKTQSRSGSAMPGCVFNTKNPFALWR